MVTAITPGKQVSQIISRQKIAVLKLDELTKIDIDYRYAKQNNRNVKIQLSFSSASNHTVDIFWECNFPSTRVRLVGKAWCIYYTRSVSIQ